MSVSNVFYETISSSSTIPTLPQFRATHQEHHFGGQNILILDSHETLAREKIQFFNSNLHMPKGLDAREVTRTSKSSCLYGLNGGIAGSLLLKNPLPLLMGLSECLPRAYAQQKVGNEFQVNTYTNSSHYSPSVTSFSNGNFIASWTGPDGSFTGVYGQLFNGNGTKIGSEFQVNTYTTDFQASPSVASFSNGYFVVTWNSDQDGSSYGVYGQLFNGNATKIRNEFLVNTYTTSDQGSPSIASLSNGNFVVTWHSNRQDGDTWGVYGQLFDGNVSKIGSEFQINTYTNNSQASPSVASFSNGYFVVTWQSDGQDGSVYGVYGQLFDGNSSKIGSEFRANTYTTDYQGDPSVASLSNGYFVVTWRSGGNQDGSGFGVYGQLFDGNGTKIGNEFQVNTYSADAQRDPSIASLSNGYFVGAWESNGQDGSEYGVYGQLFNGNGTKIGNEFQVNTYTNLSQKSPVVTSLSSGNFVVTWSSYGQNGSFTGIYGQIFHDSITYPSTSNTSTTKTTSYTTPSVSSRTTSAIGRTKTSVNPSRSWITVTSTSSPRTTSNRKATLSATSDPSSRFSWIWFLLGGIGAIFCLGLTGYLIFKSRKKDGNEHAFELGESEQPDDSTSEKQYQYTPDVIKPEDVYGYQRTPDVVKPEDSYSYQYTPDVMKPENAYGYQRTPDVMKPEDGRDDLKTSTNSLVHNKNDPE